MNPTTVFIHSSGILAAYLAISYTTRGEYLLASIEATIMLFFASREPKP
jgi:hypothetical protein